MQPQNCDFSSYIYILYYQWNIIQLLHAFLGNNENYRPGAVDDLMHYRPMSQGQGR